MTKAFAPERVLAPKQAIPTKLRSLKRCVFLPLLNSMHGSILSSGMEEAPTKWSYVHLLHGGGAVASVPPEMTAFGCRDWVFAAVITARWPDGDEKMKELSSEWLVRLTNLLLPHSKGVYGSDLGPNDEPLARRAFGLNTLRLAQMKREADPLNILGSACPILGGNDPRVQSRGIVLVICGRRCSGKDWLAQAIEKVLRQLSGNSEDAPVAVVSISDDMKREFAKVYPGVVAEQLISDRRYKEQHRNALSTYYQKERTRDVTYDAKCYINAIQQPKEGSIVILTGMRDGLDYARSLAGKPVIMIKVRASERAKRARGWTSSSSIDASKGECAMDEKKDLFWDLCYDNDLDSTFASAENWTKTTLVPFIMKKCTRYLTDTPQPGIQYRDVIGSLLLQSFAMPLWSSMVVGWIESSFGEASIDAIIAPEALGFVLAGSLASLLKKPLVLMRKGGRLVGDIDRHCYDGSNMHNLNKEHNEDMHGKPLTTNCCLEIIAGSIVPGQRILVVDDCLASGSTLRAIVELVSRQGGTVTKVACLMELPDLEGRLENIDMFSAMQFPGK